jgi:hypothetical protein
LLIFDFIDSKRGTIFSASLKVGITIDSWGGGPEPKILTPSVCIICFLITNNI